MTDTHRLGWSPGVGRLPSASAVVDGSERENCRVARPHHGFRQSHQGIDHATPRQKTQNVFSYPSCTILLLHPRLAYAPTLTLSIRPFIQQGRCGARERTRDRPNREQAVRTEAPHAEEKNKNWPRYARIDQEIIWPLTFVILRLRLLVSMKSVCCHRSTACESGQLESRT